MKFNRFTSLFVASLAISYGEGAFAQLKIDNAHVRASLPTGNATVAYMTLTNPTDSPLVIKSVTASTASDVTLHQSMNHNGMVHMMSIAELAVAAHATVSLAPEGAHIMLEGVTAPLREGDSVKFSFHFADGRQQTFSVPVISVLNE